jgi:hypothetical protein
VAATSSTFNSDSPPAKPSLPWAFLLALAILAAFEASLHFVDVRRLIHYNDNDSQRHAVRDRAQHGLAPELVFIGSSQTRHAVVMPEIIPQIRSRIGRPIEIGNYALRGDKVDAFYYVARELAQSPRPPKMMIVGISIRDLRGVEPAWPSIAPFLTFRDWFNEFIHRPSRVASILPEVVRNHAFGWCRTLRYRYGLQQWVVPPFVDIIDQGDIAQGELARELSYRSRNLVDFPIRRSRLRSMMRSSFEFDEPAQPNKIMRHYLDRLLKLAKEHDIQMVLMEIPVSQQLTANLPRQFEQKFRNALQAIAEENNIPLWRCDAADLQLTDYHFYDAQHLNYQGAQRFGNELVRRLGLDDSGRLTFSTASK